MAAALLRTWAEDGQSAITMASGGVAALDAWRHYPDNDLREPASGLRLYYHSHPSPRAQRGEHGHFHVFLDFPVRNELEWSHLVAIALDAYGLPVRLFTVNRWVTDERWYPAAILERRLKPILEAEDTQIAKTPGAQIIAFVRALLRLFEPQVREVLASRDARTRDWSEAEFEDRRRHVLSDCPVALFDSLSSVGRSS